MVGAFVCIAVFGLKFGIDFTGGSVLEVHYSQGAPDLETVRTALAEAGLVDFTAQKVGDDGLIIKSKPMNEEKYQQVLAELKTLAAFSAGSENFQSIGPVVGRELQAKTKLFSILSLLVILIYIALSFRKISRPVSSAVYSITGILALAHDVVIPLGVFAVLGSFTGYEITVPIITAFLTVFGYSINDTVVVFDRTRENLLHSRGESFESIIDKSLNQTLSRSINTVMTVLLVLFAIFFFGGASLKPFSLALILGVATGTYSSIFIATPLVFSYYRWREKKKRA